MKIKCNDCGQVHHPKDACSKPDQLKRAVETLSKPKQTTKARNSIKKACDMCGGSLEFGSWHFADMSVCSSCNQKRDKSGTAVNVRFQDDLLAKLDEKRGPLNRQDMIRKLVEEL